MHLAASRFLSGLIAGLIGTVVFGSILTITLRIFSTDVLNSISSNKYPAVIIAVFVSTMISNLFLALLYYYFENKKYTQLEKTILYIIIAHIFVQLLMIPMYFSYAIGNINNLLTTISVQIIFSFLLSQMSLELISKYKQALTFSFGLILSTLTSLVIILFLSSLGGIYIMILFPIFLLTFVSTLTGFLESISSSNDNKSSNKETATHIEESINKADLFHDYLKDDNSKN